ncbi:MAG: sulfite exporter TauE/SafE family protein [Deltaproteobacteria bacterium]|nr:MAG: sulfite exporter TauE/SafE family protein [Deltaproteobacteria bacterium]
MGMCSPLTASLTKGKTQNAMYQFGRLLGYLLLGLSAGWLTSVIEIRKDSPLLTSLPILTLGVTLVIIGALGLKNKSKTPNKLEILFQRIYAKVMVKAGKLGKYSSIPLGFMTITLPCGLLYGVVLVAGVTSNPLLGATSLFFFWLGTLPAVSFGGELIHRILAPLKNRLPSSSSTFLILIGLFTITYRLYNIYSPNGTMCVN